MSGVCESGAMRCWAEGNAGWQTVAVAKIWFTVGGCPVAVTTQTFSSHASLLPPLFTSTQLYSVNVCGLFLFVCLSCVYVCEYVCVCVCSYCQPVMEYVLGLLPHLVPEEMWLKWTPLVLISWASCTHAENMHTHVQKTWTHNGVFCLQCKKVSFLKNA